MAPSSPGAASHTSASTTAGASAVSAGAKAAASAGGVGALALEAGHPVHVTPDAWGRIRRHGPAQLRSLARALLDCGVYDDTADMLAAAFLMQFNAGSWGTAKRVALRIKRELDGASQAASVLVPAAELPQELGTTSDSRAYVRSQATRRLAEQASARAKFAMSEESTDSGSDGDEEDGIRGSAANRSRAGKAPTLSGVGASRAKLRAVARHPRGAGAAPRTIDSRPAAASARRLGGRPEAAASSQRAAAPKSGGIAAATPGGTAASEQLTPAQATKRSLEKAAALGTAPLLEGHAAWDFADGPSGSALPEGAGREDRIRQRTEAMSATNWGPAIDDAEEAAQAAAALAGLWLDRLRGCLAESKDVLSQATSMPPRWVLSRLPGGAASRGSVSAGAVFVPLLGSNRDAANEAKDPNEDPGAAIARRALAAGLESVLPRMPTQRRDLVWPPAVVQRLSALHEVCCQLDRIIGPAHPACLQVQAAWVEAYGLTPQLVEIELSRAIAVRQALDSARASAGHG
ncbi:hypothetical protein FNF29_02131 [Cafeteria roenbergensis]|uniref:Uncharacterized protein n=1 Tax=Cafeteria roenbergensis TaxID=33653 RepID=A0A5A8CR19_CAFRO|nr:hypothetical protein FNF29_02131 [Cafeteria roenbergensis]|eukprot:KAA0154987.1 hypothetical protein FNF29_02131 [Cafeteria roenbergensis]